MSFTIRPTGSVAQIGSGETIGTQNITLSATVFEDLLVIGRFAKLDAGSLDNMDGSATPVVAGVVRRRVTNAIENGNTLSKSTMSAPAEFVRSGLITVDVKVGETPAQFGAVFASNLGDADDGKALVAAGIATNAEFIEEISANVWSIRLV